MGLDEYPLERNYRASGRLTFQHHLWLETIGYRLNPTIPCNEPGLAIAEVGTGTGIWLLELDKHLPTPAAHLCGLDIAGDQFPHAEWLPPHVEFLEHDVFDPDGPPAHLVGTFDVVHLRLFIAIIKDNDPTRVLDYCRKLLKPGGHLQWDDIKPSLTRVGNATNGSPSEGMEMIERLVKTQKPTAWLETLPETFKECGYEVTSVDERVTQPWQRGMYIDNYCMLAEEFVGRAEQGGEGISPVEGFYKELSAKASEEKQLGSYVDLTLQVVVGRKEG